MGEQRSQLRDVIHRLNKGGITFLFSSFKKKKIGGNCFLFLPLWNCKAQLVYQCVKESTSWLIK